MAFKARQLKKGWFEIVGLEGYIEERLHKALRTLKGQGKAAKKPARAAKAARAPASAVDTLVSALDKHPRKAELLRAGRTQKDQLLRSLVPLYLARNQSVEVTSGHTSKFWSLYGVKYAAPNAAKALREHVGFARLTRAGRQITPNGVKYVEAAMSGRARRAA